jgi:two-component system, sensor histidine kinase PdtaS
MAAQTSTRPEPASSLALAMVAASNAPLLLLGEDLSVVAASASFAQAFRIDPDGIVGRSLFDLGAGEWDSPQLRSLLRVTLAGRDLIEAYEMDLKGGPAVETRRLVLNARRLEYGDAGHVRLLLTISDVTGARLSAALQDGVFLDRGVLLKEVQHRVANSLQIIASLLMLNARRVQSAETRAHLFDAHSRVMSVAAVQHQLTFSAKGDVLLRPYFTTLCEGLSASMVSDPAKVRLSVDVDDGVASADVSMHLGLIVTELVINALKYAFPGRRGGSIVVGYHGQAPDWTLSVTDDGVGRSGNGKSVTAGLGTSIVEALAKHLHAQVQTSDAGPGFKVCVVH